MMKQPMVPLALLYIAGLLAGQYLPGKGGIALFLVGTAVLVLFLGKKTRSWVVLIFLVAAAAGVASFGRTQPAVDPELDPLAQNEVEARLTGVVTDVSHSQTGKCLLTFQTYMIQADNLRWEEERQFLVVLTREDIEEPPIGAHLVLEGTMYAFETGRNPGDFNYRRYYQTRGYAYGFYAEKANTLWVSEGGFVLARLRQRINRVYDQVLPEREAGVLKAMVTGEKSGVDEITREQYRKAGVSHILAISGLHVALLTALLAGFLEKILKRTPRQSAILALAFVWLYSLFTGMSGSTVRAAILSTMVLSAQLLYRKTDTLNSLGLAALVILLWQPLYLWDVGFQLSFTSVLGIVLGFRWLDRWYGKKRPYLVNLALTTVFAGLGSYPLVAYFYYRVSLVGILTNLILVPALELVLSLGGLTGLFGLLSLAAARFFAGPAYLLLRGFSLVCDWAATQPWSEWHTGRPPVMAMILFYGLLLCILCGTASLRRNQWAALGLAVALGVFASADRLWQKSRITFLDVGQGDAIVIHTYDGKNIVVDGGGSDFLETGSSTGSRIVMPYLDYLGAEQVDLLCISHMDQDHAQGTLELLDELPVKAVAIGQCADRSDPLYVQLMRKTDVMGVPVYVWQAEDSLELADGLTLTCLLAEKSATDDHNAESVVLRLSGPAGSVLLTGDLPAAGEEKLLASGVDVNCTVLKLAHHGSAGSSGAAFLEATGAKWAVASAGAKNVYGHPSPETVSRAENAGMQVLSTAQQGAVLFQIDKKGVRP